MLDGIVIVVGGGGVGVALVLVLACGGLVVLITVCIYVYHMFWNFRSFGGFFNKVGGRWYRFLIVLFCLALDGWLAGLDSVELVQ